jgi:hypothetical protein
MLDQVEEIVHLAGRVAELGEDESRFGTVLRAVVDYMHQELAQWEGIGLAARVLIFHDARSIRVA